MWVNNTAATATWQQRSQPRAHQQPSAPTSQKKRESRSNVSRRAKKAKKTALKAREAA
jgi:hypothetical protein